MVADPKKRVGVIFDTKHTSIRLSLKHIQLPPNTSIHLTETLGETSSATEISEQMYGHQVAIVGFGVADTQNYQSRIDELLNAWLRLEKRPVLLLLSHAPQLTEQAITDWSKRHDMPEPLRRALADGVIQTTEMRSFFPVAQSIVEACVKKADAYTDALSTPALPSRKVHGAHISSNNARVLVEI